MEIAYYCDPITHLYWPPVLGGRSTALSTVTIISSLVLSYQVFTCSKVIINIILLLIIIITFHPTCSLHPRLRGGDLDLASLWSSS